MLWTADMKGKLWILCKLATIIINLYNLNIKNAKQISYSIQKKKTHQDDWQLFRKIFDSLIDNKIQRFKDIQEEYTFFIRYINVAMYSSCPVITAKSELKFPGLHW